MRGVNNEGVRGMRVVRGVNNEGVSGDMCVRCGGVVGEV